MLACKLPLDSTLLAFASSGVFFFFLAFANNLQTMKQNTHILKLYSKMPLFYNFFFFLQNNTILLTISLVSNIFKLCRKLASRVS